MMEPAGARAAGIKDLRAWAREVGAAYEDVALVLLFGGRPGPGAREARVCLVMKDGETVPWFAGGKGVDGLAYAAVPGRGLRVEDDPRLTRAGLRVYLNFCDARALMFAREGGRERLAGDELVDCAYRILYPEADRMPPLEEFFHLWSDGRRAGGAEPDEEGEA